MAVPGHPQLQCWPAKQCLSTCTSWPQGGRKDTVIQILRLCEGGGPPTGRQGYFGAGKCQGFPVFMSLWDPSRLHIKENVSLQSHRIFTFKPRSLYITNLRLVLKSILRHCRAKSLTKTTEKHEYVRCAFKAFSWDWIFVSSFKFH